MKFSTKGKIASLFSLAVLVASAFLGSDRAYAASAGLSVSKGTVEINEEFIVSVGITDAASWDIHVVATGPAENCVIDRTGATEPGETEPGTVLETVATSSPTFSVTCTATEVGEVGLALSGTITDGEGESAEVSESVSVTASAPAQPEPTPEPPHEDPEPTPEPAPEPVDDDGGEEDKPSVPEVLWPVPSTTNPETPSDGTTPEASETEETNAPSDATEEKDDNKNTEDEKDEDGERTLAIAGSSDDDVKKTFVIILAVVATLIGLVEAFLILSSRRKERLQTLREKAQALQVVTATMQLAKALDKKA